MAPGLIIAVIAGVATALGPRSMLYRVGVIGVALVLLVIVNLR